MRERFSEINITGNTVPLPVGAEAKNITLEDGSILEQALGEVKLQENGSIIDQINKIDKKIQENTDYAPLTGPRIKNALSVRRYNKDNILSTIAAIGGTQRGITATYSLYQWEVSGTITSGNNTVITLYGTDNHSVNLAGSSDYLITIKNNINNVLLGNDQEPIISLRFDIYNPDTGTSSIYVYQEEETKNFTIPVNSFLYRVSLNIYADNEDTIIDGILKFESKDLNDQQQDTYNVVFDVQQDLNNKKWTTTVAENLVVSKGLQSQARSSLGTIYNSKWEGSLNVTGMVTASEPATGTTGFVANNGLLGFVIKDLDDYSGTTTIQKATDQRKKIFSYIRQTTPYFIAPMYLNDGLGILRYGALDSHNFYVGSDGLNGSGQLVIKAQTTEIRNILNLGDNEVYTSKLVRHIQPQNFADIEKILLDSHYLGWKVFLVFSSAKLGRWLAWRNDNIDAASVGIAWKTISNGEYALSGYAFSAAGGAYGFASNPGIFKYRYSFYPNQTDKKRKFVSYKICNANPATINQYVQVRLGQGMNGTGSNVAPEKSGMWTTVKKGTSLTS